MKATFVETSGFQAVREDFISDEMYARLQIAMMMEPEIGVVMPGCGGLRKMRIPDPERGKGKRSGARVIYLHVPEAKRFFMIDIYGKDEKVDLSPREKKSMKEFAETSKRVAIIRYQAWQKGNRT